jgi:SAM-dependent methyltransferase
MDRQGMEGDDEVTQTETERDIKAITRITMNCNFCSTPLTHIFLDLHHQPPSNAFLTWEQLEQPETYYPLKVFVCDNCWLAQVPKYSGNLFTDDYPYYSSQSPSNVSHAKEYVDMMCKRFGYHKKSNVMEIGSNDGYLLQWFKKKGIPCMGVEPSNGPANVAREKEIFTVHEFFGKQFAINANLFKKESNRLQLNLICSINVLAQQPDINDFVAGLKIALKPGGVITMEFPHLMKLVEEIQFDTIYHEHYSYFSLLTLDKIFSHHGLRIWDVDEILEHGGSLRIYAKHCNETNGRWDAEKVRKLVAREKELGMDKLDYYQGFQSKVEKIKSDLVSFLTLLKQESKMVVAYGAAAKGNTLLNFCGIRQDLVEFVVDRSPYKQDWYLPGSHIPVYDEEYLVKVQPDYVLILPWNLKEEIMEQLKYIREWDGKFITAIPTLEVI